MNASIGRDAAGVVALVRADLTAGRRALGTGSAAMLVSSTGSLALGALLAMGAVAVAAFVHGLATGGSPDAAAGVVDLLFTATLAAGLVSPMAGGPAARIVALAGATAAPVGGRVVLVAAAGRELLAAPVGPALAFSVGAACGLGAATGLVTAALAATLAVSLAVFALFAGVMLALVTANARGAAIWRLGAIAVAVLALASVSGGAPASDLAGIEAALSAVHAARGASFLLPSWWSAAPLHGGGIAAWWPLVVLPLAVAWIVWSAPGLLGAAWRPAETSRSQVSVRPQLRLRGLLGALFAKDVALLLRDRGLHVAVLRHSVLALVPLVAVVVAASVARADARSAARLAGALPQLALVAHLAVVAQAGLATFMVGTDGGGATHMLWLPVRAEALVASKALAWVCLFAPLTAIATAGVVLAAGVATGADAVAVTTILAGLEGAAAGCAGAGAGIVAAVLWPCRPTTARGGPPHARTGVAGLAAGVGAAGLTAVATTSVALAFHSASGLSGAALGVALGLAALGLGIGVGSSLLRLRRERVAQALAHTS